MPLLSTENGKYLTEPADGIFFNMNAIVPVIAQYCSEAYIDPRMNVQIEIRGEKPHSYFIISQQTEIE